MRKAPLIWSVLILAGLSSSAGLSAGCKKKKKPASAEQTTGAAAPGASASKQDGAPSGEQRVVTDGPEKDLLLSLRRVHFALDTTELQEESRAALVDAAAALEKLPKVSLFVDGHTDDRGTTEYNVALSERRARSVVDYLTRLGVKEDTLKIIPHGSENPLESGTNTEARAENRRVEFRVMEGTVQLVLEAGTIYADDGTKIK